MSNFPIIRTTPPPLDLDISEEEDTDLGSFNDVSPDGEKDIDFVVPDFEPNVHQLNDISKDINSSINENRVEDNSSLEIETNICINSKIISNCDNSINLNEFPESDIDCDDTDEEINRIVGNDLKDNDLNELNVGNGLEKSEEVIGEEFQDFECVNHIEDVSDFADFTSFKFTEYQQNSYQNQSSLDDNRVVSINESKTDTSFGDFTSNVDNNTNAINSSEINDKNDLNSGESDDDFADFASAQPVVSNGLESISNLKTNSSDSPEFDGNDGEFADFSSFQDNSTTTEVTEYSNFESNSGSDPESNKLTELFAQVFPSEETLNSEDNSPNISRDLFNSAERNSKNLWKSLQDLESAPSLKLRWPNSHSFQLLLAALNIDPRNILRNPSVPMFASGLGCVLEPTKPKPNSDDFNDSDLPVETTNHSVSTTIPPVQFDWSSSGLTNPLDINPKSMVAFDLDFFVTNDDVKNTNRRTALSSFEDELLNDKKDHKLENNSQVSGLNNTTNIVQQILSSVGNSSSISDSTQVLSAEALQVLDELPNLSFMRAKVLMFPIKQIPTNN